ncbi:GSCOCG00002871001-RA-CDS [Cotesia congregata]|uniref:Uncharacterized protein n=1 Tax=Cotesia congregata TaxID=51543 RepID=A0A8J2MVI8_COTCN|nr:GSCOCG00002871001-RA-CDS [Cotesia congregata]CAG5097913.1 Protein of unknown function [Cotesia congregata]
MIMKAIKEISLCFLLISVIQCNLIKIYDSSTSSRPTIYFHARKLLELCFSNEFNPVAISVDLLDVMDEMQRNEAINSSILVIDQYFSSKVMEKYYTRHPSYLITADSMKILRKTLQEIKSSRIWNVASVIIVIGEDCDRAAEILQAVWKIEAFNSFYVCPNKSSSESFVFIFNPYAHRAPEQWTRVEVAEQVNDSWTLYRQPFRDDPSICPSVVFDKTRSLDGYSLNGFNIGKEDRVFKEKKVPPEVFSKVSPSERYIFTELFTALNVTPVIYTKNIATANFIELFKLLANGTYDMSLQYTRNVNGALFDVIPLYVQRGFLILTKKRSTIPVFNAVTDNVLTYQTTAMSAFTLIIIFIIILVSYRYDFGPATLEIFSLILGMGISTPLTRLFMRVTFLSATLFGFFFCPVLQSQFTSVLTSPGSQENIETFQELYDNQYRVFYHPYAKRNMHDLNIWKNSTFRSSHNFTVNVKSCLNYLRENSVACVLPEHLLDNITIGDLHISKEPFFKQYNFLRTGKNFPLKNKIDKTAMNLVEAGLVDYFGKKSPLKRYIKKQKLIAPSKALEQEEFLDLPDFSFFFWRLAFILSFSILVSLIEFAVYKLKKYIDERSRRFEV